LIDESVLSSGGKIANLKGFDDHNCHKSLVVCNFDKNLDHASLVLQKIEVVEIRKEMEMENQRI
jgi:hypothetical protein